MRANFMGIICKALHESRNEIAYGLRDAFEREARSIAKGMPAQKPEKNEVRRSKRVRNFFICFTVPPGAIGIDRVILVRRARVRLQTVYSKVQEHRNYIFKIR